MDSSVDHGQRRPLLPGAIEGDVIAGIGVTPHPGGRIVVQYPSSPASALLKSDAGLRPTAPQVIEQSDVAPAQDDGDYRIGQASRLMYIHLKV